MPIDTKPVVIPVASGKGGVGKSFIAANLAMALARMGHRTIAADLDFGGSNLYHFLGLPNRNPGIGDFFSGHASDLKSLLVPTAVSNLHFLPGDGKTPLTANLPSAQKAKLLRHLRALPAEYLVLDIGAGSSLHDAGLLRCGRAGAPGDHARKAGHNGHARFPEKPSVPEDRTPSVGERFRGLRPLLKELMQLPMADQPPSFGFIQGRIADGIPARRGGGRRDAGRLPPPDRVQHGHPHGGYAAGGGNRENPARDPRDRAGLLWIHLPGPERAGGLPRPGAIPFPFPGEHGRRRHH